MSARYILGRAATYDDAAMVTPLSSTVIGSFFIISLHAWPPQACILNGSIRLLKGQSSRMFLSNMTLGFPGCCASTDCIHIPWECLPSRQTPSLLQSLWIPVCCLFCFCPSFSADSFRHRRSFRSTKWQDHNSVRQIHPKFTVGCSLRQCAVRSIQLIWWNSAPIWALCIVQRRLSQMGSYRDNNIPVDDGRILVDSSSTFNHALQVCQAQPPHSVGDVQDEAQWVNQKSRDAFAVSLRWHRRICSRKKCTAYNIRLHTQNHL